MTLLEIWLLDAICILWLLLGYTLVAALTLHEGKRLRRDVRVLLTAIGPLLLLSALFSRRRPRETPEVDDDA